jgi:hypothetical protein
LRGAFASIDAKSAGNAGADALKQKGNQTALDSLVAPR